MNNHIQYQLIRLYCYVSDEYYNTLNEEMQRLSNNCSPKFSDEEVIATHLWGIIQGQKSTKAVHSFIKNYWLEFFPKLPGYAEYNRRINLLAPVYRRLLEVLLTKVETLPGMQYDVSVMDSFPIMVASGKRAKRAKVAPESCSVGYCAVKNTYYYGLKLHTLGFRRENALPVPETFQITTASTHDLTAMKPVLRELRDRLVFADKAFIDREFQEELQKNNTWLLTPHKKRKGETEWETSFSRAGNTLWATALAAVRQPIEAFFSWLNDRFDLQQASKVRSDVGLWVFVLSRLSAALFCFASV